MNRRMLLLPALCLLPAWAADQALPKAETLLDKYVEVTGGKAAYEKRRSEVMTIQMEIVGRGIKGTLTRYTDSSNNSISTGELEGVGKMEEGVYHGQAWENTAIMGPRVKSGAENDDAVRDSYFNAPLLWRKLYQAETVGVETVNGEDCYKIMMTPLAGGKPQYDFLSRKTGLILKTERTMVSPMGEISVQASTSDYKSFEGILYPTKVVQNVMGNQVSLTMIALKANQDIPKDRFEPPAEIKKLMAK
ncbi:MAG: hypothetical protein JSU00_24355 [Acidobacteria bacterium]|nr:hypothetical protein [Acidobacteriota bacterium]